MQEHILTIQALVYGGNGLGRLPDGKAVFVPFVLPGETVKVRIREEKQRHAFADLLEVLEKSPLRIEPQCIHYQQCGGCHFQHIAYPDQLQFKRSIFLEQLQRMGGSENPPPLTVKAAEHQWGYRNALQFHTTESGELAYMDAANARPFAVRECLLPMDAIASLWPQIALTEQNGIDRLELRQNPDGDVLLILEGSEADIPEIEITLPVSAVHISEEDVVTLAGEPFLTQTVDNTQFKVSAASFFQTNFQGASALVQAVMEMTAGASGTLLDLYCGVGLFSRFLADRFTRVIGVELSESACDDYIENMEIFENVSLFQGPVERALPEIDVRADCAIVDPPRKGLDRFALDALVQAQIPQIIYVSCDPSTLARDVQRLTKEGYTLKRTVLVDMFPQTFHIESVVLMSRI